MHFLVSVNIIHSKWSNIYEHEIRIENVVKEDRKLTESMLKILLESSSNQSAAMSLFITLKLFVVEN